MDETPKRQPTHLTLADRRGLRSGSPAHCECAVPRFDNVTLNDSKHYGWIGAIGAMVAPAGATVERCCACGLPSKEQHDAWEAVLAARDEAGMQRSVESLQAALEKVSKAFGNLTQALTEFIRRAHEEQVPDDAVQRMVLGCASVMPWTTPKVLTEGWMTTLGRWAAGEAWSPWIWAPGYFATLRHYTHDVIDGVKVYTFTSPGPLVPCESEHPEVSEYAAFDEGRCFVFPIGTMTEHMGSLIRIAATQGAASAILVGTAEEIAAWRKGHEAVARAKRHSRNVAAVDTLASLVGAVGDRSFFGVDFGCDMGIAIATVKVRPDGTSEVTHSEVRRTPGLHHQDRAEPLRASAAEECTGIAASWCPVHGDCSCPRSEAGEPVLRNLGACMGSEVVHDPECPLHGEGTNHAAFGDDWPETTTMNASPPCGMLTPPAVMRQAEAALGCSLSPAYAHAPGSLDAYPLGQAPGERLHGEMRSMQAPSVLPNDWKTRVTEPDPPHGWRQEIRGEWKVTSTPYEAPIFVDKTTFKVVVP